MLTVKPAVSARAKLIILCLSVTGCTQVVTQINTQASEGNQHCNYLYEALDKAVENAGISDAGSAKIAGFPHLRVNRFLSIFAKHTLSGDALADWLERMRQLDHSTRILEISNLPYKNKQNFRVQIHNTQALNEQLVDCGQQFNSLMLNNVERTTALMLRAEVSDAYVQWQRWVGLYPIVRFIAKAGIENLHGELSTNFRIAPSELPLKGRLIRYSPKQDTRLTATQIQSILAESAHNPLGIPDPDSNELNAIFDTHAPSWEIDSLNDSDKIGTVFVDENNHFTVDTTRNQVYRKVSYTRFSNSILLQLNYIAWFPSRPKESPFDLYGGPFDGLIWRVTLGRDGRPLAYDSIHPCGCYYLIFPRPGYALSPPGESDEPVLSPGQIPAARDNQRLVIRIAHRTHYIDSIYTAPVNASDLTYGLINYTELRSLKIDADRRISFFDAQGLVTDSQRLERFLLWPLGVPSAGAMRQWGTHAIAFVGRRHFDDPDLLDKLLIPAK